MLNGITLVIFDKMSQLARSRGKNCPNSALCIARRETNCGARKALGKRESSRWHLFMGGGKNKWFFGGKVNIWTGSVAVGGIYGRVGVAGSQLCLLQSLQTSAAELVSRPWHHTRHCRADSKIDNCAHCRLQQCRLHTADWNCAFAHWLLFCVLHNYALHTAQNTDKCIHQYKHPTFLSRAPYSSLGAY